MKKRVAFLLICTLTFVSFSYHINAVSINEQYAEQYNSIQKSAETIAMVEKDICTDIVSYKDYDVSENIISFYMEQSINDALSLFNGANEIIGSPNDLISPNSIIGSDGRTKVSSTETYPYSAIAYIETDWPIGPNTIGTAWLIGKNAAVTAAHCLYDPELGGWANDVKIWPGKDGFGFWNNPYGTATSTRLAVLQSWISNGDSNYDWGLIELDEDIGDKTGRISFSCASDTFISGSTIKISGYPGDHQYYQYEMLGSVSDYTYYKVFYQVDTYGGQSGSPILINNVAYGIHTNGTSNTINGYNSGVRITTTVYAVFNTFIDECD